MSTTLLQVDPTDIRQARIITQPRKSLDRGQVRIAIDRFALTSNNVTYAVAGDSIGYWKFYPAPEGWGHVPCWGLGNVIETSHPELPVGERFYGFFPMASDAVLTLGRVTPEHAMEASTYRRNLPGTYNLYQRTATEPATLQAMEDERCIFFPLFATSYLMYDYLLDNDLFGADQVLIGSASSKTAIGLARLLQADASIAAQRVALTSAANAAFVEGLGIYDRVVVYGDEASQDAGVAAAYVDMSGDAGLTARLHQHFAANLRLSLAVGATHWEAFGGDQALPGPKPEFFFAPAQIAKRDAEWGRGEVMRRATEAVVHLASELASQVRIRRLDDASSLREAWRALVDNQVPPGEALIASLPAHAGP